MEEQTVMGIAEALATEDKRGGRCHLTADHLAAMPDDLRGMALQLLDRPDRSDVSVSDAFTAEGYTVSAAAIRNYRRANGLGRYSDKVVAK